MSSYGNLLSIDAKIMPSRPAYFARSFAREAFNIYLGERIRGPSKGHSADKVQIEKSDQARQEAGGGENKFS
jgi:hypothetical protein